MDKGNEVEVKGIKLICPVCGGSHFTSRNSLLNSRGATFLGFDWANQGATNYICVNCSYIFWFAFE